MRILKQVLATAVCAVGLLSSHAAVTVTTVEELLAAAASAVNSQVIEIASPDGAYPVTFKMTDTLVINEGGTKHSITLRGATGNPDDVILDFSAKPMQGIRMRGQYNYPSKIMDLTVQNATNQTSNGSALTSGGGISTQDCTVRNCVIRNCVASHTAGKPAGGGVMYHCKDAMVGCVVSNCAAISYSENKTSGTHYAAGGGIFVRSGGVSDTLVSNCWTETEVAGQNGGGGGIGTEYNAGLSLSCCRVEDCKNIQRDTRYNYYSYGGGVYCGGYISASVPSRTFSATNCYFKNAWVWVHNGSQIHCSDCTFEGATGNRAFVGNNNYRECYIRNCKFLNNPSGAAINVGGTIESCLFKGNGGSRGSAYFGYAKTIRNCVFEENEVTATGEGGGAAMWLGASSAIALNAAANMVVEDCLFLKNAAVACTTGGGVVGGDWNNNAQTNLVVRNCYFSENNTPGGTIFIYRLRNESLEPSFENGYGLNIVNCTFDSNVSSSGLLVYVSEGSYLAGPSVFFRNCHFTGAPGYKIASTGASGYADLRPDHIQYCVADPDITNLPTSSELHNVSSRHVRNRGYNQLSWMLGAQDVGDGTYTLGTSADYGVTITLNNRRPRILNDTVDVGCFEFPAPGLMLLLK